jgi:hypothetical protein
MHYGLGQVQSKISYITSSCQSKLPIITGMPFSSPLSIPFSQSPSAPASAISCNMNRGMGAFEPLCSGLLWSVGVSELCLNLCWIHQEPGSHNREMPRPPPTLPYHVTSIYLFMYLFWVIWILSQFKTEIFITKTWSNNLFSIMFMKECVAFCFVFLFFLVFLFW